MKKNPFLHRCRHALLAAVVMPFAAVLAHARTFDIPAQDLSVALEAFARQADKEILFDRKQTEGKVSTAVKGDLDPVQALHMLADGNGLTIRQLNERTFVVGDFQASDKDRLRLTDITGSQTLPANSEDTAGSTARGADTVPQDTQKGVPEILVKGSRVMNVDVKRSEDDVQPYTILDAKQIERSGATNIGDFLKQQLTMNTTFKTAEQTGEANKGVVSSINLRGLGANETLVLVNGRRSAGVSILGNSNQTDINGIPMTAVERIEVLPASASAIYGGAAVGGVVNVVLKKNFNGGDLRYTYDKTSNSDANRRTLSGSYGMTLDDSRTELTFGGQYSDGEPLLLGDRMNIFGRGISTILRNDSSYLYNPTLPFTGASPNIASADTGYLAVPAGTPGSFGPFPETLFDAFNALFGTTLSPATPSLLTQPSPLTLKDNTPLNSPITWVPAGTAPGSDLTSALLANAGTYNLNLARSAGQMGLLSAYGTVPRTKSAFATVRQALAHDISVFAEISASSNASRIDQNPFGNPITIAASSPVNPFQQSVSVRFPSTATVANVTDSRTKSATLGLLAPLSGGWNSELDYTWSRNTFEFSTAIIEDTMLKAALDEGDLNPFVDTLAYPLDLSPYLVPETFSGASTLQDATLRASGPVGSLPAGRPTLTVGLGHRKESTGDADLFYEHPLIPENTQLLRFFGQSQSTDSIYAEALVPLIAPHNAVPAVHSLELQIAGRSERYTVHTGTPYAYIIPVSAQASNPPQGVHSTTRYTSTNPTVGLKYQPIADLAFRASYSTAFLPPTAGQLLPDPRLVCGSVACQIIVDPVTGTGYSVNYTTGGNADLNPQTSKNWNFGAIWTPQARALQGLRMNLEYYKITQPDYITTPTVQQVLDDPSYTSRVTRDPDTGLITIVDASYINATTYKTSGWDLKADYRKPTSLGTFGLRTVGTLIKYDLRQTSIGAPLLEYVDYPNDGGEGTFKANATLDWEWRNWTAAWTTAYYSSYTQSGAPGTPGGIRNGGVYTGYTNAQGGYTIPSQMYHDLFASYAFDTAGGSFMDKVLAGMTLQLGVNNVFAKKAPIDVYFAPYFYSAYGDVRLRNYRLSVVKAFQ